MFKILNPVRHWQRGKATRAVLANTPVVRTGYRFPTAQSYAEDVAQMQSGATATPAVRSSLSKTNTRLNIGYLSSFPRNSGRARRRPLRFCGSRFRIAGAAKPGEFVAGLAVALRLSGADFAALMPTIRAALDAVKQAADVFPEEVPQ